MSSEPRRIGTSTAEVANITTHGVWLLAGSRELFMPDPHLPFFKDVAVAKISNVEEATPGHSTGPNSTRISASKRTRIRVDLRFSPSRKSDAAAPIVEWRMRDSI